MNAIDGEGYFDYMNPGCDHLGREMVWANGYIIMYSIDNEYSLDRARDFINRSAHALEKDPHELPMIIVGNKFDLENERKISIEDGQKLSEECGCPFFEASAKENINVKEVIDTMIKLIDERCVDIDETQSSSSPSSTTEPNKKKCVVM